MSLINVDEHTGTQNSVYKTVPDGRGWRRRNSEKMVQFSPGVGSKDIVGGLKNGVGDQMGSGS